MHKVFGSALAFVVAGLLAFAPTAGAQELREGTHYMRLKNPQSVNSGRKVEVLEFFSYGCPHCNDLDPIISAWAKKLPPDVEFKRVPVQFGREAWKSYAKIFYTLEAMGVEDKYAPGVFAAIHDKRQRLEDEKVFLDWAAASGLDRKKVEDTYRSFTVNSKLARSDAQARAYAINSVPMVIVDGKYMTQSSMSGGHAGLPGVLDQLIAKARTERKS